MISVISFRKLTQLQDKISTLRDFQYRILSVVYNSSIKIYSTQLLRHSILINETRYISIYIMNSTDNITKIFSSPTDDTVEDILQSFMRSTGRYIYTLRGFKSKNSRCCCKHLNNYGQYKDWGDGTGILSCYLGWHVLQTWHFQDDVRFLLCCLK
jgi:hypothetical protein